MLRRKQLLSLYLTNIANMKFQNKHKGLLLALVGVLFITPDSLSIRLVGINSWELMFYRGLIPFACLFFLLILIYKKNFIKVCLAIGFAGILNAILVALGNITFVASLENTNVANTLIMISLAPFMAAIFGSIFLKEYPNIRTWITMLLCFSFVIYIFYDSYESQKLLGDIFGFATAIIIGASSVVIRYGKLTNFLPSLMLGKVFTMIFTIFFVSTLVLENSDIILILVMCIFFVFIPISLITLAPRYIAAHEVQLFFVLETALGPIWVWYFINERPTDKTIIGGIAIIIIIFIYTILESRDKKTS
jgi:drug/metabolite transporter (DMT)-like permease